MANVKFDYKNVATFATVFGSAWEDKTETQDEVDAAAAESADNGGETGATFGTSALAEHK